MRNIRTAFISFALLFAVAGCTSSGNDFFASLWSDVLLPDTQDSANIAQQESAPQFAGTDSAAPSDSAKIDQEMRLASWRYSSDDGDFPAQFRRVSTSAADLTSEFDNVAALEFYTWAAVRGDAFAQLQLGHMYATGQGVAQDLVTAYAWLNLATMSLPPGLEHDRTVASREFVARHLRPAEISEAHRQMGKMVVDRVRAPASTTGEISVEADIEELGFLESLDLSSGHS